MLLGIIDSLRSVQSGVLDYLYISLSNICNARCAYCDVHQAPGPRRMPDEQLHGLLAQAQALGCRTVHFLGGGEPLVDPHFERAVESCVDLGLQVVVTTNGSHLGKRLESSLGRSALVAVLVSLDSHLAAHHDEVRGRAGLWSRAVEGIRRLRAERAGTRVVINHVLTRHNADALAEFIEFAGGLGAAAVNLIPVKDRPAMRMTAEQTRALAGALNQRLARAAGLGVELQLDPDDVARWSGSTIVAAKTYQCVFPEHALYVDCPTGAAFPCDCTVHREPAARFEVGNVWTQPLAEIWRGEPIARLRDVLASPCDPGCKRDCDWNNVRTNSFLLAARDSRSA